MVCRLQTFGELDVDDATPGKSCSMPAGPTHRRRAVERQVDRYCPSLASRCPRRPGCGPYAAVRRRTALRSPSWTPSTCSNPYGSSTSTQPQTGPPPTAPKQAVVSRPQPTKYAFATAGARMRAIACPSSAEVWCQGRSGVGGDCGRREIIERVSALDIGYAELACCVWVTDPEGLTAGHPGGGRSLTTFDVSAWRNTASPPARYQPAT